MSHIGSWKWCLLAVLLALGSALLGSPQPTLAQPVAEPKLTKLYFGVSACQKCHGLKEAVPDKEALLYRGTEMTTWGTLDKHKDATRVLYGERGRQMGKILGWDVANDTRCVRCHGVHVEDEKYIHKPSFGSLEDRQTSGVNCVACHGAYMDWVNAHAPILAKDDSDWKKLTRVEKTKLGLRDLWNPEERARLCSSCHVGSIAEGKVVTHEMYAAGHPPLPGIEVATFGDAMPRHWETLSEKVRKRPQHKEFHKKVHLFDADQDDLEQTRLAVVSAVVVFGANMKLLEDVARQEHGKKDEGAWPELALFDCYACHHDLKKDSWRLRRPTGGKPGRPLARPWPTALLPLALQGAQRTDIDRNLAALRGVFNQAPFGNPGDIAERAKALVKDADTLLTHLRQTKFTRAHNETLIQALAAEKELLDFDSARQVAWAFRTLMQETGPEKLQGKTWDMLKDQLKLDLPRGQVTIAGDFLREALTRIADWNPETFHATLQSLARAKK